MTKAPQKIYKDEYYLEHNRSRLIEDTNKHSKKKQVFTELQAELQALNITIDDKPKFKIEPMRYIQDKYMEQHKEKLAVFPVSFAKLSNMLDHDFSKVFMLVGVYGSIALNEDTDLVKEHYNIYAETPNQIERLIKCKNIINALHDLYEDTNISNYARLVSGSDLKRFIDIDSNTGKLKPKTYYVLNGIIH